MLRFALVCLATAALAVPALAGAAERPPRDRYAARLLDCDAAARSASFRASMRVLPEASGLELAFALQSRAIDAERFAGTGARTFGEWLTADPGRERYIYDKGVQNLPPGSSYRVKVRFRWRDAAGAIVARSSARSGACRVPENRPNLRVLRVFADTPPGDGTRTYRVAYVNDGRTRTPDFVLGLSVDGVPLAGQTTSLDYGQRKTALFTGPACAAGGTLSATVDASGLVDEVDEADNTLTVPCPT